MDNLEVLSSYLLIDNGKLFYDIINKIPIQEHYFQNLRMNYENMILSDHTPVRLPKKLSGLKFDIISYNILNSNDKSVIDIFTRDLLSQIFIGRDWRGMKPIQQNIFEVFQSLEEFKNEQLVNFIKKYPNSVFLFQEVSSRCLSFLKEHLSKEFHIFDTKVDDKIKAGPKVYSKDEKRVTLVPKSIMTNNRNNKNELNTLRGNVDNIKNMLTVKIGDTLIVNLHNHWKLGQTNIRYLVEQVINKRNVSKIIMMGDFNNSKENIEKQIGDFKVIGTYEQTFLGNINCSSHLDNAIIIEKN